MTDIPSWLHWLLISALVGVSVLWISRWYLIRKRDRVIDTANARMQFRIPESSLTQKKTIIERLLHDPGLLDYIDQTAGRDGVSRDQLLDKARQYAREIGPSFNTYFYFVVGYRLSRTLLRLHYWIQTVAVDNAGLEAISPASTVVLVSNHRSNMDPLLITYLALRRSTIALSAGEWARSWPLAPLIRAAGGYVVDRDAVDPLYRQVLAHYVHMVAASGVHHAVFPEGELTRDGKLQPPKLGFLSFFCRALSDDRDIVFVPVGINYDRIPEDRNLAGAQRGFRNPGRWFLIVGSIRYIASLLRLPLSRREHRFGYACAAFGAPLSLRQWLQGKGVDPGQLEGTGRFEWLPELADELMSHCGEQIPVPPVVIVASVMCDSPDRDEWSHAVLQAQTDRLVESLTARGAHVHIPGGTTVALNFALEMLTHHKFVKRVDENHYSVIPSQRHVLRYYANSISHLMS